MTESICIYTKEIHNEASLKSGDHIFLAAIGGIKKLPKSYVSHDVNNYFSNKERLFSRESIISIIRQFEGPGKRGKLNENKATKSKISVMDTQNDTNGIEKRYFLGYIKLGKPYIINQLVFSLDTESISFNLKSNLIEEKKEYNQEFKSFFKAIKNYESPTLILDSKLPNTLALFGKSDNKWFLAVNNEELVSLAEKRIRKFQNCDKFNIGHYNRELTPVTNSQEYNMDLDNFDRIIAKMAFNFLACKKGSEFVLKSEFDSIRSWILEGTNPSNKIFVSMCPSDKIEKFLSKYLRSFSLGKKHFIIIIQLGAKLRALVSLYGSSFNFVVNLTELKKDEIAVENIIGLICDWENRKEYSLSELISSMN